jgi:hypothetical protein
MRQGEGTKEYIDMEGEDKNAEGMEVVESIRRGEEVAREVGGKVAQHTSCKSLSASMLKCLLWPCRNGFEGPFVKSNPNLLIEAFMHLKI